MSGSGRNSVAREARRVAWFLTHNVWPPTARHVEVSCGNRKCCNPKHLLPADIHARFWRYVEMRGANECWPWKGPFYKRRGYGQFKDRGRRGCPIMAHRYAYETVHGEIGDPSIVVMHSCDNPPCCNPAHLSVGTHADNVHDMLAKGRAAHQKRATRTTQAPLEDSAKTEPRSENGEPK